MTRREALGLVALLAAAYPSVELKQATVNLYAARLEPLPVQVGRRAVDLATASQVFFPSLAELLAQVAQVAIGAPGPMEAWEQASTQGATRHPLVVRAMRAVGGQWTIAHTENPTAVRAQFVKAYEEFCKLAQQELHTHGNWEHVAAVPRHEEGALPVSATRRALPARTNEMDQLGAAQAKAMLARLSGAPSTGSS